MIRAIDLLLSAALAVALASVKITAVPGIESAAALGVLLPLLLAGTSAHRASRERARGMMHPERSLAEAVLRAGLAFVVVAVVAALRLALEPACADASGFAWLALGPLPGMLLAALVGEAVGRAIARPRRAAALSVLVIVASYLVVAWEILMTPAVYVFTIFGGHWPGPIYDEGRKLPEALLSYRLVSTLAFASLFLALRFGPRSNAGRGRAIGLTLAFVSGCAFVLLTIDGTSFGHRTSVAHIDVALGAEIRGERCHVHLPSETPLRERRRFLAECEAHIVDIERILEVRRRTPLHAFVYRSPAEKASLVGAGETYVAKPWRGEVHVQRESFPHAVLRHEIVHVIAAEIGPYPLRVSGALGGLVMNPGLVEGLAVAVSWEPRDGMTPDEWSRAMLELESLPRANALMGSGFLGQGASASYAAAGSFIAHLLRTRGAKAVGAMYLRGSVGDDATIEREERAWHEALVASGPPSERTLTKLRFRLLDRGLLATRCGRLRARIFDELGDAARRFDHERALDRCDALLAIDSKDSVARYTRATLLARGGDIEGASAALERMRDGEVPLALRARIHSAIADAILRRGIDDDDAARAHLRAALEVPQDDETARALEVRLLALDRTSTERDAILRAVLDPGRGGRSEVEIGARLALVSGGARDGLAAYLLGRRLANEGRSEAADFYLEEASLLGMPTTRLSNELAALRRRHLVSRALEGDEAALHSLQESASDDPSLAPFERALGLL